MFDVEKAIAAWRHSLQHHRAFFDEDVRELESHVRDHIEALVARGYSEEEAFRRAMREVGGYGSTETEYRKVFWDKLRQKPALRQATRWGLLMLKNYLKVAWRNLRKHRGYAFINISGLALGLATCFFILLYVQDELSYDRFHDNADRIYRVAAERHFPDRDVRAAVTPRPLAQALERDLPEVEQTVRVSRERAERVLVRYEDRRFFEDRVLFADPNFFNVFSFPLVEGDPATVLAEPFSVVLAASVAKRYFGNTDVVGRTLELRLTGDRDVFAYRVTGVVEDVPDNTHLSFDLLASYQRHPLVGDDQDQDNWLGLNLYTYVLLRKEADRRALEAKLPSLISTYIAPQVEEQLETTMEDFEEAGNSYRFFLQPLTDIHLRSQLRAELSPGGDATRVYLFGVLAGVVLLLACVNFVNLNVARSTRRAREVGIRKTLGSHRMQLVRQFLSESMLLSFLALLVAAVLVAVLLPVFNDVAGKHVAFGDLGLGWMLLIVVIGSAFVGVLAGGYPALYLSGFQPVAVLKGETLRRGHGGTTLRNVLVVFQFAVCIALIVATLVVQQQLAYVQNKALGFAKEQVVVIEGTEVLGRQIEAFKQTLQAQAGVVRVTNAQAMPGQDVPQAPMRAEGSSGDETVPVAWASVGFDFIETLGLELKQGRSLSRAFATDSLAAILNETAVRELGLTDPVGQSIIGPDAQPYTVIGVVEDFHFASLHEAIGPLALLGPDPTNQNRPNLLVAARIQVEQIDRTLDALAASWNRFVPQQPFVYSFLDEEVDALYRAEQATGRLISIFAGLALLIACLGLLGLSAITTAQRTKEIGIRKVMGASVESIVILLAKEFLRLVIAAFIVAAPVAYIALHRWLNDFAYRIELSWRIFLIGGSLALAIALVMVSYQAIRAAVANPVESLRYE